MQSNNRKRMLKLAQAVNSATTATTSTSNATIAAPPSFQASSIYGWLSSAYNTYTISLINQICTYLNTALHYSSNGQYNFQALKNQNFQVDISSTNSTDSKNLLLVSMLFFKTFLNSGNKPLQPFTSQQIDDFNKLITSSPAFLNIAQLNPTSGAAQKIQGNLHDIILNLLKILISYNIPKK